jgi:hypothetical protein
MHRSLRFVLLISALASLALLLGDGPPGPF